jgi:hypothetical protein
MGKFANIRERINVQARHGPHEQDRPDVQAERAAEHSVPSKFAD